MSRNTKNAKVAKKLHFWSVFLGMLGVLGGSFCHCRTTSAADTDRGAIQKILTGLKNPRGVAVRPDGAGESGEVFVAEGGAGRVVKLANSKPGKSTDVVAGFSTAPAPDENLLSAGIQSLQFLDHSRLVVAGGDDDGTPFVRLYELPESNTPLTADQHKQDIHLPAGKKAPIDARIVRGIARSQPNDRVGDALIISTWGDREPAGLVVIPVRASTLSEAVPIAVPDATSNFEAGGIAVGSKGHILLASGSDTKRSQSGVLRFLNPLDRHVVMQVPVDLQRIVALAYSPRSGNLYAANFPTVDDANAGVYRIDEAGQPGAPACTAMKIADVPRPTALAFAADGTLYVTSAGDSKTVKPDAGTLLKLTGEF